MRSEINKFNTTDFVVMDDKIRVNKSLDPIGYYQINLFGPGNLTWTSTFYNYRDRSRPYDTNTTFYTDGVGSVDFKYNVTGGIRNSRVYYNHGDKIMFKHLGNGIADVNASGDSHLYQLWKIPSTSVNGWGTAGNNNQFLTGYYKQFTWDGGENELRDWRAWSIWSAQGSVGTNPYYTVAGAYNDQLAYTLESGNKYMIARMVDGIFCDTPLIIHVNDPYYSPDQSYIPTPQTL
jgi:hypothetical protein